MNDNIINFSLNATHEELLQRLEYLLATLQNTKIQETTFLTARLDIAIPDSGSFRPIFSYQGPMEIQRRTTSRYVIQVEDGPSRGTHSYYDYRALPIVTDTDWRIIQENPQYRFNQEAKRFKEPVTPNLRTAASLNGMPVALLVYHPTRVNAYSWAFGGPL